MSPLLSRLFWILNKFFMVPVFRLGWVRSRHPFRGLSDDCEARWLPKYAILKSHNRNI
jgi:hypothetical protein